MTGRGSVGDALDRMIHDVRPRRVGGLRVETADRIRAVRQPKRERRHVELVPIAIDPEAELEQPLDRHIARFEERSGDAADEVDIEPLVAGRQGV